MGTDPSVPGRTARWWNLTAINSWQPLVYIFFTFLEVEMEENSCFCIQCLWESRGNTDKAGTVCVVHTHYQHTDTRTEKQHWKHFKVCYHAPQNCKPLKRQRKLKIPAWWAARNHHSFPFPCGRITALHYCLGDQTRNQSLSDSCLYHLFKPISC